VRALHELGKLLFADGLPPYPEWWPEVTASGGRPKPAMPAS